MEISFDARGPSIGVVSLSGRLDLMVAHTMKARLQELVSDGWTRLVVDLLSVTSVDSSGLGELTIVYTTAAKRDCPLRLVGVSEHFHKLLDLTKLDAILVPADSVASAKKEIKNR